MYMTFISQCMDLCKTSGSVKYDFDISSQNIASEECILSGKVHRLENDMHVNFH